MKPSKKVYPWNDLDKGPFKNSKRNWMAVKTYQEIDSIKVPGDKLKPLKGIYIIDRGDRM